MLKYAFLFCAFIALSGQNARFVYKHSYLKDSLKPDAKTEDVTFLDVSPKDLSTTNTKNINVIPYCRR